MFVLGMNEVLGGETGFLTGRSTAGVAENDREEVERRGRRFGAEEFGGPRLGGTPGPARKLSRNFLWWFLDLALYYRQNGDVGLKIM